MALDRLREQVGAAVEGQVAAVAHGYRRFAAQDAPDDAKGFAAHHAACKAALAHLDLLVRLVRWAEAEQCSETPQAALLAEARAALADDEEEVF